MATMMELDPWMLLTGGEDGDEVFSEAGNWTAVGENGLPDGTLFLLTPTAFYFCRDMMGFPTLLPSLLLLSFTLAGCLPSFLPPLPL